jgi:glutathione S-transferase
MALYYASITVEIREVSLANKPWQMLQLSAKGTVPVLHLPDNILDESMDIMYWALSQSDPDGWINAELTSQTKQLIQVNDYKFKGWLDKYKYWERFPEQPQAFYREQAEFFIGSLEAKLSRHNYLLSDSLSLADVAVFPFIRQFASVDRAWFDAAPYPKLQRWLQGQLMSDVFSHSMVKQPFWREGDLCQLFSRQNPTD